MQEFDENIIIKTLKIDARAIGIPSGAAEIFIDRAIKDTKNSFKTQATITEKEFNRALIKELKKYNHDFAYVYQNRDKII